MQIFVKTLSNKTITLDVKVSDMVAEIKAKIEGLPVRRQKLKLCGKILRNEETLDQCGVEKDCTLHLSTAWFTHVTLDSQESRHITIMTPSGRDITLNVDLSDTVGDLKAQIAKQEENIAVSNQVLFFHGKQLDNDSLLYECNMRNMRI